MTRAEFDAWLEGFSEAIEDSPTPKQWEKIKAKLAEVTEPINLQPPVVIREYRRPYRQWPEWLTQPGWDTVPAPSPGQITWSDPSITVVNSELE